MQKQAHLLMLVYFLFAAFGSAAQSLKPVATRVLEARQQELSFRSVRLFQKTGILDSSAARFAEEAQFLRIKKGRLQHLISARPEAISFVLPCNESVLVIDLVRVETGFPERKTSGNSLPECSLRLTEFPVSGIHYRGVLRGAPNSLAAFSFFEDEVWGIVSDAQHHNLVLGKVQRPGNSADYMLYSDKNLAMDNPFECLVQEIRPGFVSQAPPSSTSAAGSSIRIALEADHSLVQRCGSGRRAAMYLEALFNQIAAFYANEQIDLHLTHLLAPSESLYETGTGAAHVLEQFRKSCGDFDRSYLAHLVGTAQVLRESAGYQDGLCRQEYAAAISAVEPSVMHVPTFSWAAAILAHEIGHQLGARHTQWCGWPEGHLSGMLQSDRKARPGKMTLNGTLMGYCSKAGDPALLQAGLGEAPGNMVRKFVAEALFVRNTEGSTAVRYATTPVWPLEK
ncbi:MAG: hypothetical protein JNJ90_06110 [Saprospiraceae bacterium]|nr:hypothetical protein [Saprospiraceae bacterium]